MKGKKMRKNSLKRVKMLMTSSNTLNIISVVVSRLTRKWIFHHQNSTLDSVGMKTPLHWKSTIGSLSQMNLKMTKKFSPRSLLSTPIMRTEAAKVVLTKRQSLSFSQWGRSKNIKISLMHWQSSLTQIRQAVVENNRYKKAPVVILETMLATLKVSFRLSLRKQKSNMQKIRRKS